MSAPGVTIQELEGALVTVAYIVVRHGPRYAPILERLERELEAARQRSDPIARAQAVLERYTLPGGTKAILDNHSRS